MTNSVYSFFFRDTATPEIYTLSLHDALPISVLVTGRAAHPVYLRVDERGATLKDARSLWGRTTRETVDMVQASEGADRKSTRLNSSHVEISYAVFCLKKKKKKNKRHDRRTQI